MPDQPNQTTQPAQSPQELRQQMLEQLDVRKKTIEELSDEELEEVAGGGLSTILTRGYAVTRNVAKGAADQGKVFWNSQVSKSGAAVLSASGTGVGINNSGKK